MPREMTDEEVEEEFLNCVAHMLKDWAEIDLSDYQHREQIKARGISETEYRLEGVVWSMFSLFGGSVGEMPSFALVPDPHPENKEFQEERGENWWPQNEEHLEKVKGRLRYLHEGKFHRFMGRFWENLRKARSGG